LDRGLMDCRHEVPAGASGRVPGVVGAGAAHGHNVEQANESEKPVYLAFLVAHQRERTVLPLEPSERFDQKVHTTRIHEGDRRQIDDDRSGLELEHRLQDLSQRRRGREVDFAAHTEHRDVVMLVTGRQQTRRQRTGRQQRPGAVLLRSR